MCEITLTSGSNEVAVSMRSNDGIQPQNIATAQNSEGRCFLAIPFVQKVRSRIFFTLAKIVYIYTWKLIYICAGNSRGSGNILHDICWLWGGGGWRRQRKGGYPARNIPRLGLCRHGHDLRRRPHFRRPFQPRRHPCFCLLQQLPMETGN